MFVVVSYDIVDNKRRRKVMKTLEGHGERVQYSVFECQLEARQIARLRRRLMKLIKAEEDDVRFYLLCEQCVPRAVMLGKAEMTKVAAYRVI